MKNVSLIAVIFFLTVFYLGCGKKGNPVPPEIKIPKAVNDLSVKIAEGEIVLAWSVPESNTDVAEFKIYRSALEVEGDSCVGCPREYLLIAELSSGDPKLLKEAKGKINYLDSKVKAGWLYSYKIEICNSDGYCSGDSNIAEIKY
ncbi:MAG: hypothetical protein Q7J27_10195 [Syntrophales bacterium]|nr:hypothetical protein [Syntrophales bacterium]